MGVRVTGIDGVRTGLERASQEIGATERKLLALADELDDLVRASAASGTTPEGNAWEPRKTVTIRHPAGASGARNAPLASSSVRGRVLREVAARGGTTVGVQVRRHSDGSLHVTRPSTRTAASSVGAASARTPEQGTLGVQTGRMLRSIGVDVSRTRATLTVGRGARYAKYFVGYSSRQPARPILPTHEAGMSRAVLDEWIERLASDVVEAFDRG